MTVPRQLGSSRQSTRRRASLCTALRSQIGKAYRFFNSEYELIEPLVNGCKQRTADFLIANSRPHDDRHPVTPRQLFSSRQSRVHRPEHQPGSRSGLSTPAEFARSPKPKRVASMRWRDANGALLPGTPIRVESLVTPRKQTVEHVSTRDERCQPLGSFSHLLFTNHDSRVTTHALLSSRSPRVNSHQPQQRNVSTHQPDSPLPSTTHQSPVTTHRL